MTCEAGKVPKVSVCVVTYNQEKYIAQCLQSIVEQQTDFNFEIIVSDDCSQDDTPLIISEFASKHDNIRCIKRTKNLGAFKNFSETHKEAIGQYVCHCDGDDYWLPNKLQKQVDFLDENLEFSVVWHKMILLNVHEQKVELADMDRIIFPNGFTKRDLLQFITIGAHSSKMYRLPSCELSEPPFGMLDFYANIEHLGEKKGYIIPEVLGAYRAGIGIASSGHGTRKLLSDTLGFFYIKYPTCRKEINTAALLLLLLDIKNTRPTFFKSLKLWLTTFHPYAVFNLINNWHIYKVLRSS